MTPEKKNLTRLYQVFAAKLVLEVFGGGGAIWGFSEVCTLRNPETQEHWRFNALVVAFLFFCRFLLNIKDFIGEMNGRPNTIDKTKSWKRFIQIFAGRLVLEVFGGGGAIWGFSEAATLRIPETQEFWRLNAAVGGFIFFIRWLMQCRDYITEMNGKSLTFDYDEKTLARGIHIFSAKMVLQVWGGGGAIWGFFEAATFRVPETQEFWRFNALTVGFIFFIRWFSQIKDFKLEAKYGNSTLSMNSSQWIRLFQIFGAKLVLEVFGGGGAIWGFSEAATLRVPETQEFWRFNALTVGFIFFIRFALQIIDYVTEIKENSLTEESLENGVHETTNLVPASYE